MSLPEAQLVVNRELGKARLVLMGTYATNGFLLSSWFSRLPSMADRVGVSSAQLGIVLFALTFSSLLAIPVGARNLPRWRATRMIRIAGPLTAAALLLAAASTQIWQLTPALVFFGMANGMLGIGLNSHATTICRLAQRQWMPAMFGCASAAGVLGAAIATFATAVGIPVLAHLGFVAALCLTMSLTLGYRLPVGGGTRSRHIIAAAGVHLPHPVRRPTRSLLWRSPQSPPNARPDATILLLIGATLGATIAEGALANFSIVIFRDVVGAGLATATLAFTIFSVAMAGVRLCGGWLASRVGSIRVLSFGGVLAVAAGLVLASRPGLILGFLVLPVVALGIACAVPLTMQLATAHAHERAGATEPESRRAVSAALAGVSLAASGGYLSGGPILGLIATLIGLPTATLLVPAGALALSACSLLLWRRKRSAAVTLHDHELIPERLSLG